MIKSQELFKNFNTIGGDMGQVKNAKLIIAIHRLREEAGRLERQATEEDNSFMGAAAIYGSELAGPGTEGKHERARALREKADLLEQVQKGQIPLSQLSNFRMQLLEANTKISTLQKEKKELEARIALLEEAEKIVNTK